MNIHAAFTKLSADSKLRGIREPFLAVEYCSHGGLAQIIQSRSGNDCASRCKSSWLIFEISVAIVGSFLESISIEICSQFKMLLPICDTVWLPENSSSNTSCCIEARSEMSTSCA